MTDELQRRRRELAKPISSFQLTTERYSKDGSPDTRLECLDGRELKDCIVEGSVEVQCALIRVSASARLLGLEGRNDLPCVVVSVTRNGGVRVIIDADGFDKPEAVDWLCAALGVDAVRVARQVLESRSDGE